jgi:archaellum component FlaF (FlaF/FlaG flagellin family)
MALPVTVPNTFAGATASIPLSQLDANFNSLSNAINGIANGVETLANVQVTGGSFDNISVSNVTITTGTSNGLNVANASLTNVSVDFVGNLATQPKLKFYNIEGSALGVTSGSVTINLDTANFYSATTNANATWSFANASPANTLSGVVLALSNGGAYDQTWTNVDWAAGTAPTLTANGLDILVFVSYDAGTTWHGMPASLDSK